jgi:hypothetical protein
VTFREQYEDKLTSMTLNVELNLETISGRFF